jgi:transketolase
MRDKFIATLTRLAEADPDLMLLTGDLGFGVLTDFAARFPRQYLNVGVAEQNMTGVAAGLALAGKRVFTYSIANFPTLRCLEQIRNDVCYHDLPVTIVSIGGGLSYGPLGFSHQATEDLAIMRALPNMTVVAPGDDDEAEAATVALSALGGPAFLRLDRGPVTVDAGAASPFELGRLRVVRQDIRADVLILSTGAMLATAVAAGAQLSAQGVGVTVVSAHTLKPFDAGTLHELLGLGYRLVVTVEEHSVLGGLGAATTETVCDPATFVPVPVLRLGLPDVLPAVVGSQDYLREHFGLSSAAIAGRVMESLARHDMAV